MVHADGVNRPIGNALPQGFAVRGRADRREDVVSGIQRFEAGIVQEQVVQVHVARDIDVHLASTANKVQRLAASHLFEMDRHLQESSRFKHRVGSNRLRDTRNALHAQHVGESPFVNAAAMAERPVHRLEEEALARHLAVFHRQAEEARMRNRGVAIAKASDTRFGKFHHFSQTISPEALAVGAEELYLKPLAAKFFRLEAVDHRGKLVRIVNRVRRTFVKAAIETALAHGFKAVRKRIDVIAERFHKIKTETEKGRQHQSAVAVEFGRFAAVTGVQSDFVARFKRLAIPKLCIFKNNVRKIALTRFTHFHCCDLQPKGRERPYGRQHRWSPDPE